MTSSTCCGTLSPMMSAVILRFIWTIIMDHREPYKGLPAFVYQHPIVHDGVGDPYGNRTRVFAVKGRRPRPLDEGTGGEGLLRSAGVRVNPRCAKRP